MKEIRTIAESSCVHQCNPKSGLEIHSKGAEVWTEQIARPIRNSAYCALHAWHSPKAGGIVKSWRIHVARETSRTRKRAARRQPLFQATFNPGADTLSVAPHDIDGLISAVLPRNRYGLRGAARHIGPVGRYDGGRISMGPIPGNIIGIGLTDIA
jgi:hypothetical protein